MGKFFGFGKDAGEQCHTNEDGSKTCDRLEIDGSKKLATGTHYTYTMDSDCNPVIVGDSVILEKDQDAVQKQLAGATQACKRGLA